MIEIISLKYRILMWRYFVVYLCGAFSILQYKGRNSDANKSKMSMAPLKNLEI